MKIIFYLQKHKIQHDEEPHYNLNISMFIPF